MGINYKSCSVIGIKLVEDDYKAKILVRKKAFKHSHTDDGRSEFCTKSGRRLWFDDKEEIEADYPSFVINRDEAGFIKEGQVLIDLPEGIQSVYSHELKAYYIGIVLEVGSEELFGFRMIPEMVWFKKRLKDTFEKHSLWNDADFGLHSFTEAC